MLSDLKEAFSQKKGRGSDPEKIQNKRKREENDGYAEMKMAMTERGEGSVYQEPARGQLPSGRFLVHTSFTSLCHSHLHFCIPIILFPPSLILYFLWITTSSFFLTKRFF